MVSDILPLLPQSEFYCEPFCGGAAIFWAKKLAAINVLNDANLALVTLYRTLATDAGVESLLSMLNETCFARFRNAFNAPTRRKIVQGAGDG